MKKLLRTSEVAQMMGISVESVRRFDNKGILSSIKTPYGHRRFDEDDVLELMSKGSLKAPKNTINADEQGFGDEEQKPTYKSIKFGSDGILSDELFRQHDEKVKVKRTSNSIVDNTSDEAEEE
jgi:excisionase family DNA binding protein